MPRVRLILCACVLVMGALVLPGEAQQANGQRELVGCVTRDANGGLQLLDRRSGKTYSLGGNLNLLQRHIHQLVALPATATAANAVNVDTLRVVSDSCTSAMPSKNVAAVAGKVGEVIAAPPVTTTLSAGEVTPGFQTEAGRKQLEATGASEPYVKDGNGNSPYAPLNSEQAGQSEAAANTNAAAASRAEMYPSNTLGVTQKAPPLLSAQSLRQEKKRPLPNESATPSQ